MAVEGSAVAVRQAGAADLAAVRQLLVVTWLDTYDAVLGSEEVVAITDAWHSVAVLAPQLEMPRTSFLVAENEGMIVGHLFANAQRPPLLVVSRLYVLPDRQRRGIGAQLLATALRRHADAEVVRLDVAESNRKALSFYRRQGFQDVSRITEQGIEHIRMEKPLAPIA